MKKKIVLIIVLVVAILGIAMWFSKSENEEIVSNETVENQILVKNEVIPSNENTESNISEITEEEQTQISEYIKRICNEGISYVGLLEFQDINNANKEWIYSRVTTRVDLYYITEEQIKSELLELFGENLVVDVESDTSDADGYFIPRYNTEKEMYEYIPMGGMIQYSYIIDSITKNGNDYVVDVIEYSEHEDLERDSEEGEEFAYSVFSYNYNEEGWDKIFESDDKTIEEIETQVMEQKSEFPLFTITLEKVDDEFYVKTVERN